MKYSSCYTEMLQFFKLITQNVSFHSSLLPRRFDCQRSIGEIIKVKAMCVLQQS